MSANFITVLPIYNQDYPADLLRPRLSSISAWIHHFEYCFRHTFPNTHTVQVWVEQRQMSHSAAFNQKGVKLKLKYDLSVNNSYVSIKY